MSGPTPTDDAGSVLYARSWRLSGTEYPSRETIDLMLDVLIPQIAVLPGYRGGTMMIDREHGDILATTYWDTMAHLEAGMVRSGNAAAGLLVVADAQDRRIDVWDVVYHAPPPPFVNRDVPPERR